MAYESAPGHLDVSAESSPPKVVAFVITYHGPCPLGSRWWTMLGILTVFLIWPQLTVETTSAQPGFCKVTFARGKFSLPPKPSSAIILSSCCGSSMATIFMPATNQQLPASV